MDEALTKRFAALLSGPGDELPLGEAVLLVAGHDHPVDRSAQLDRLEALAARCGTGSLHSVIEVLFGDEGFRGDEVDYHHPDNSFLDRVLDRRRGLPILLSVVTAEVAARCGVGVSLVGMPGHFLLRDGADPDVFIDPFRAGRLLDRDECQQLFRSLHPAAPFDDAYLDPIDDRAVLLRVVTNLVHTFTRRGPIGSLAWALRLRALLAGGEAWLAVARISERTGDWHVAADAWEHVGATTTGDAHTTAGARAASSRARVN